MYINTIAMRKLLLIYYAEKMIDIKEYKMSEHSWEFKLVFDKILRGTYPRVYQVEINLCIDFKKSHAQTGSTWLHKIQF